ncbi:hypothetical protein BDV19DRAFT_389741 [Aspergillus venezuelensis]
MEEYRVYSSLWHLQHYSAPRKTASERWKWSIAALGDLEWYSPFYCVNDEQVWTVAAILSDMGLQPIYGHYPSQLRHFPVALEREGEEAPRVAWEFPGRVPLPFFGSFDLPSTPDEISDNIFDTAESLLWPTQKNVWPTLSAPEKNKVSEIWHLSPEFCGFNQIHLDDFRNRATVIRARPKPSDVLSYFKPWRRMSLVIWDSWRMYTVGRCHVSQKERTPTPDGGFLEPELPGFKAPDMTPRRLALVGTGHIRLFLLRT